MEDHETIADFAGIWELLQCIAVGADGKVNYPYGEKPLGQLFYNESGNMMVEIMKPGIKKFVSPNPLAGTPEEILPAYSGFIAYYGTYRIMPDSDVIIHHLKGCSFPNWINHDQARHYSFENKKLKLSTSWIGSERYELTWQRIK